jgi:putative nucleotidyltransferase with HDIG domain
LPDVLRIDDAPLRALLGEIAAFCDARSVEVFATGGFLRDAFLGAPIHDIDLTIAGDPLTIGPPLAEALGGTYFPLREERGQARILLAGRGLHIDLMPLRGTDIEADLRLRDYTVDALGAALGELAGGEAQVIDPTGGFVDLRVGVLRMTGEGALLDDPLRLLRGPRIATQFGFRIEPETASAIHRNAGRISEAAAERQRDELIRIFATEHAAEGVRLLDALGLFVRVLPEMEVTRGVEQPKEHHHDVLGHSLAAVGVLDMLLSEKRPEESPSRELWDEVWGELAWCAGLRDYFREEIVPGTPRRALLKFCGLLHDIGKPETKSIQADGRMRFFGHSDVGARIAGGLMRRLHFPTRETAMVEAMIDAHLRPVQLGEQGAPTKRAIYRFFRDTAGAGIDTMFLSLADHLGTVGPNVSMEGFRRHVALTSHILHVRFDDEATLSPPRLVDGDDLMAALGIGPGVVIGDLLEAVREAQAAGEIETREQALSLARARLAESGASAPDMR